MSEAQQYYDALKRIAAGCRKEQGCDAFKFPGE